MGRTRRYDDQKEEAKKRHFQSLCDACCIRSLELRIRASLCCADDSFLEALAPRAQMPHEIGSSSDARIYIEEMIKSLAQQSRKETTFQTQEFQGNQCTQKLQTTKKSNDPQQPQTSESTVTTAPSQSSQQPQTFESTEVTVPALGHAEDLLRPQRFISLEADFLDQHIPGPYEEAMWAACLHHPHCDVYEEFHIEPLDVSRDGTRLRVKFVRPCCPPDKKPLPAHLRGLPSTYCQRWASGLKALDTEDISDFVLADADQANLPIIPLLVLQLAAERAAIPVPLAADSKEKVTVSEKEIPQVPKHQVQRHKKFPVLCNLFSLGVCLLPLFWWQRYKKSRQL
ncbi:hypothetical protein ASPACDRAFT_44399 [Aspergillus aculeatus ATCC 16872]|uniref:Uncharacterized protein n=1 Tax=Aspergillus aculeatus (strain ATCC 16872 / CBS 172.66 / WB 5094) TaxID=690307 RepID=A0A1L9WRE9_ASPA1|nr:uncharacterized protein ASPACDRAFT_44399 [Aspergillus aculeatus ATCC 16872]OJJ98770.1 hypothetical protein ASPACDRAFT_44399 [Aspergillus aculeatus ATCC 16872]